ncbi:MAG: hypothetical protein J7M18_02130 [Candidatus Eremiobacteraeota bacterium]|nr:hypothetical protein [Candidatus Eremiobacteraeota bacterium]
MIYYHPMLFYSLAVKARVGKSKPGKKGFFHKLIWWFRKLKTSNFFLFPEEILPVQLLSPDKVEIQRVKDLPFYPSPFELTLAPSPVRPSGWKMVLRGVLSVLIMVPFIAGLVPQKAFARSSITPRVEKGSPATREAALRQFGLLPADRAYLEVSDCPLRINQRLLAAVDCVTAPHTFKIGGGSGTGLSHINSSWPHSNTDSWYNTTEVHPYTDVHYTDVPQVLHTNLDEPGYSRSS